jgi:hypothetical protein
MQNNSRKETVTIPLVDYLSLLDDSLLLEMLQNNGVDNWEGYGEAYKEYAGTKEIIEYDGPVEYINSSWGCLDGEKSCPYNCDCGH